MQWNTVSERAKKTRPLWLSNSRSWQTGYFWDIYPGDGYAVTLNKNLTQSVALLRELEGRKWIDYSTRVLFIDFNLYNPNVNIFNAMQIIFEYSAGGLVYPWARFLPISFADQEGASHPHPC